MHKKFLENSAWSISPTAYGGAYFGLLAATFVLLRTFEGLEASEALAALTV